MAHRFGETSGWTKVKRKRKGKGPVECRLNVDVTKLGEMVSIEDPTEVASYSIMLRSTPVQQRKDVSLPPELIDSLHAIQLPYQRTMCADRRAKLMSLNCSPLPLDLNAGYGTQTEKCDRNEFLSLLLECMDRENLVGKSEFVCFRSLLTNVSSTPFKASSDEDYGMVVVVQKIDDVFYMFELPTEEQQSKLTDSKKRMMYWGMKFESYATGKRKEDPIDYNSEFCSVLQTRVNRHSITFRAEIDCCKGDGSYVELKTSKNFPPNKLLKWWLQCSFGNVKKIMCGVKNGHGFVENIKWFHVDDLLDKIGVDKPAACLSFLDQFLQFVKDSVQADFVPHVFKRQSNSSQFEMRIDKDGNHKFIPAWFVDGLFAW